MFERLSRSWDLVKASGAVLKQDKALLVFPLISSIAAIGVVGAFALPMFAMGGFDVLSHGREMSLLHYALGFLFYVVEYFVVFYFNAALVGAAMIRLDGGDPTVRDGLSIASSKARSILGYALIAATVGMVLRAIQERVGFLGRIVVGLVGIGWSLATFLVVPVLVARNVGPVEAVRDSAELLKRTWGENVIGQGGIGVAFGLIFFAVIIGGAALIIGAALSENMGLVVVAVALVVIAAATTILIQSALSGIYSAALYRYATTNEGTSGFSALALGSAFRPK